MGDVQIDGKAFLRRVHAIVDAFKTDSSSAPDDERLSSCDAFCVLMGGQNDEVTYSKTAALHTWLLGYEFPSTLMLFTRSGLTVVTSASKAKWIEPFKNNKEGLTIDVLRRSKDDKENETIWQDVIKRIEAAGKRVGSFPKEKQNGKVAEEWVAAFNDAKTKSGFQDVDAGAAFSATMASKDDDEQKLTKTAARMTSGMMSKYFVDEMSGTLDDDRKVTHEALAEKVERKIEDKAFWKKVRGLDGVDLELADWCYTPIIQSGGKYDLKTSAQSNKDRLEGAEGSSVILASMGIKYKSYCTNIGRTWLIDPHKSQQKNYTFLLELQQHIVTKYLHAGMVCRDVYDAASEYIKAKQPALAAALTKNVGYVTGLEFRDSTYILSPKNTRKLKQDMTVVLAIGLEGLDDPNHTGRKYSLLVIDTVKVNKEGAATFLTDKVSSATETIFFKDDDEEESAKEDEKKSSKKRSEPDGVSTGGKVLRNRTRTDQMDSSAHDKFRKHQKELAIQKQEDGLGRFADQESGGSKENGKTFKKFESYKKDHMLPAKSQDLKIFIDQRAQTIVLPIYGFGVPFHINTLKNVSKSDEGDFTYLRFNFISPGQIAGKKEDVPFEDPDATFVRSMSFRSSETSHFADLYHNISELKKAVSKEQAEKKELADVIEQDKLKTGKARAVLTDTFPRPGPEGKRVPGNLEIHENGMRWHSPLRDQRIDVLFNNVKHIFFQPCDNELIVLIHFHLNAPIMVGKRKTKDVQFYREASDVQFDETGNRKRKYRGGDEDEIELEQEERRRRHLLNKEFKSFTNKIIDATDNKLEFDTPFRELGFSGVPFRNNVLIQPTTHCIVHLTDPPFFVVALEEIEIVHLERVSYGLKNFDMVIINQDFSKPPMHINSIDVKNLDPIKEYFDSCDICVSEGPVNLNWTQILNTIRDDPYGFFEDGGWSFLSTESDSEDNDEEDESASGSDFGNEVNESDVYDDESTEDDDGSEFGSDEDSGSGSAEDEEDSGEDWDELERKAKRADDKKRDAADSDDERGRKKGGRR